MLKQILWGYFLAVLTSLSPAALIVFEDWEGVPVDAYVNGCNGWMGINRSDEGFWIGNNAQVAIGKDDNHFVRHMAPSWQSRGFCKTLGSLAITDGQTATLYLTFKAEGVSPLQHCYALTDVDIPNNSGQEVVCVRLVNQDANHYRLEAVNGNSFLTLRTNLVANLWYHLWLVIDHATDTYDVYLTAGSDPKAEDRVGSGLAFRYTTVEPLDTFYAWAGKMSSVSSTAVCLDQIAIDPTGVSLYSLIPLSPDLTGDYWVNLDDLVVMSSSWLEACGCCDWCGETDVNKSGVVDFGDLSVLSRSWHRSSIAGLVGWWSLNEGRGSTAFDRLGRHNGTLFNTEPEDWVPSGDGYVLGLDAQQESDGRGEYLYLPRLIQDNFTISFWVRTSKIADVGDQWWSGMGMADAEATGVQDDFGITLLRDKAAFGVGGSDTGDVTIQSTTAVNDGYWHHIAATRNGTTGEMCLYVDGILEASAIGSVGPKNAQPRILVGSMNFRDGKYLRGYFDEICFYDQVLFASDIASLADRRFPAVTPKKGVGSGDAVKIHALHVEWVYNWNISLPASMDSGIDYVPMRHNKWWPDLNNLAAVRDVDYLLGYNEPDGSDQADMTVAEAIAQWPLLQAKADEYDLLLGSPATVHYNSQWIQDFMAIVDTPGSGLRVDYICVHCYYPPNPDTFMNNLTWVHNRWGRDVWVTEFNVADWSGSNPYTQEQAYTCLAELLYRMEQTSWLRRYAIFPWDGSSDASKASPIFEPGTNTLTPLGKLYASWDGDIDGPNEGEWYFLNHQGSHNRIRSNGASLEMTTIFSMGDRVQWRLVDAGNGWYYIENKAAGQRLGYDSAAGSPAMADEAKSGDEVKWKLIHSKYGWYYVDHKQTGKRLCYRKSGGKITLESTAYSDANVKWRFIKP